MQNGLYGVDQKNDTYDSAHTTSNGLTIMQFHSQMGHITPEAAWNLVRDCLVTGIQLDESSGVLTWDACTYAKMTCASVLTTQEKPRANRYSDEVHLDMWGPFPMKTLGRKGYYVTFTDDHSCETHLELLSHKSDIFEAYKVYEAKLKPQKQINIKALWSDWGGEHLTNAFINHLVQAGTICELMTHDSPAQNGVAEHLNRTILKCM